MIKTAKFVIITELKVFCLYNFLGEDMITRISSSQVAGSSAGQCNKCRYLESEERAVSAMGMPKKNGTSQEMSPFAKSILTVLCSMVFMTGFIFLSGLFKSHK